MVSTGSGPAAALAAVLAVAAAGACAAPPVEVIATASMKVERTMRLDGQPRGPVRTAVEAMVDACNGIRQSLYGLPPVSPPAEVFERLDRRTVEKYLAGDRAATYITTTGLDLPDFKRWSAEARGADPKPELPPDCARHTLQDTRSGTIWRDGRRIQLRFDARRAIVQPAPADFTPRPLPGDAAAAPLRQVGGQSCREVTGPALAEFAGGTACLWAAFPLAARLNLPWALAAERRFGMPGKTIETDTLVDLQRNPALAPALFEVPEGFEVTGR